MNLLQCNTDVTGQYPDADRVAGRMAAIPHPEAAAGEPDAGEMPT